jgi:hypothetical protein
MSDVPKLKRALLEAIAERVHEFGFKPRFSQQEFKRRTQYGFDTLHVCFYSSIGTTAALDIAMRINDVEELCGKCDSNPLISERDKKEWCTIGKYLAHPPDELWRRWDLVLLHDVPSVADSMVEVFVEVALPFFQRYSDRLELLNLLDKDNDEAIKLLTDEMKRSIRAIACTWLWYGRDAAVEIAQRKKSHFVELRSAGYSEFEFNRLIDFLNRSGILPDSGAAVGH